MEEYTQKIKWKFLFIFKLKQNYYKYNKRPFRIFAKPDS